MYNMDLKDKSLNSFTIKNESSLNLINENKLICEKHNDELLFFCLSDLVFVCQQCLLYGVHKNHKFLNEKDIENRCNDINSKIYLDLEEVHNYINESLKIKNLLKENLKEKKNQILKSINHHYNSIIEKINKDKENIIDSVNEYCKNYLNDGIFENIYNKFEKIVTRKLKNILNVSKNIKVNFELFVNDKFFDKNEIFRKNLFELKNKLNEHKNEILNNFKIKLNKIKVNDEITNILFKDYKDFNNKYQINIVKLDKNEYIIENKKDINFTFININESYINKNFDQSIIENTIKEEKIKSSSKTSKIINKLKNIIESPIKPKKEIFNHEYTNIKSQKNKSFLKNRTLTNKQSDISKSFIPNNYSIESIQMDLSSMNLNDERLINLLSKKKYKNIKSVDISKNKDITNYSLNYILNQIIKNNLPNLKKLIFNSCYKIKPDKLKLLLNNKNLKGITIYFKNIDFILNFNVQATIIY